MGTVTPTAKINLCNSFSYSIQYKKDHCKCEGVREAGYSMLVLDRLEINKQNIDLCLNF